MGSLISFVITYSSAIADLVDAGIEISKLITQTNSTLRRMENENRGPTDSEWDALNKITEELRAARPDVN